MNSIKLILFSFIILFYIFLNNTFAQWVQVSNGIGNVTVWALVADTNYIFAGTELSGVYLSANNGTNWIQTSLNDRRIRSLAINGIYLFAGTGNLTGVYLTTNNGTNWTQTSFNNKTVYSLAINGNNIFAGIAFNQGIFKSTDNGTNWSQTSLNNRDINTLLISGNIVFAGTGNGGGVYKSTDNGNNWFQTSLNNWNIYSLALNSSNVFAGAGNVGVFKSTNSGINWTQTSLNVGTIYSLAVSGNNVFAGTHSSGVIVSNDNGANWMDGSQGLGYVRVNALCILSNYILAGTLTGTYRRPLSELVGIKPASEHIPKLYALFQNYPNPFNPITKIRFQIAAGGRDVFTTLVIYDILGREVISLVNEELKAGTYEVELDGTNIASGIYFYHFRAANYTQTKKMLLIK